MILCDFYNIQLFIKKFLNVDIIKFIFQTIIKIVNFLRHAKHQLNILRRHQKKIYEKNYSLIASIIFC